jgi:hypothetical protein
LAGLFPVFEMIHAIRCGLLFCQEIGLACTI